jgi:hypothetical protein
MSSGWSCQYMGTYNNHKEWCLKLKHACQPGCKGCVITGQVTFSTPQISDEQQTQKIKKRHDHPLEK